LVQISDGNRENDSHAGGKSFTISPGQYGVLEKRENRTKGKGWGFSVGAPAEALNWLSNEDLTGMGD